MAIRWDKFTVKAQEAVQRANEVASENGNPELLPAHLLTALLEDKRRHRAAHSGKDRDRTRRRF